MRPLLDFRPPELPVEQVWRFVAAAVGSQRRQGDQGLEGVGTRPRSHLCRETPEPLLLTAHLDRPLPLTRSLALGCGPYWTLAFTEASGGWFSGHCEIKASRPQMSLKQNSLVTPSATRALSPTWAAGSSVPTCGQDLGPSSFAASSPEPSTASA